MRPPKWFKQELADQGGLILERAVTDEEAAGALTAQVLARDGGKFGRAIVDDYVRKQLRKWTGQHQGSGGLYADDGAGQLDLFPEIPRRLEVAPGRFADQAVMTGPDWDNALKQAKTKADNASGYFDGIKQVYDKVRPLLTDDDLTTADVWRPGGQVLAAVVGGA